MPLARASAISCSVGAGTAATTFFFCVVVVVCVVVEAGVCAKATVAKAANARAVINFFMETPSLGILSGDGPPCGEGSTLTHFTLCAPGHLVSLPQTGYDLQLI